MSLAAVNPKISATVFASAGTGKTWQLVTRLLRLLLEGADPGSILAMTFTRKAAGEMQTRLLQRLEQWAVAPPEVLATELKDIGLDPTPARMRTARNLYERVLLSPQPVRATTFHAFCQELLSRFPLEAGAPPGFDLIEESTEQQAQAMTLLLEEAESTPDSELAGHLLELIGRSSSINAAKNVLLAFMEHRSDWWAWTEHCDNPVAMAKEYYASLFEVDPNQPLNEVLRPRCNDRVIQEIKDYAHLLALDTPQMRQKIANQLASALAQELSPQEFIEAVGMAFKTDAGKPRAFTLSAGFRKKLGDSDSQRLESLHSKLERWYDETTDLLRRYENCQLNILWVSAGSRLIDHFQAIKKQRRQLDFADLEWLAYRLLNHSADADVIQYKLDERIDHLLIDEFQDTNPTQWRLILPLLEEFAAASSEKPRTVFLVGDTKQSIYRFRRANPELQDRAANWMSRHLSSENVPLDISWRSAEAIMTVTNQVFSQPPFQHQMANFPPHATHRKELWGRLEILPRATIPEQEPGPSADIVFRNPLTTALPAKPDAHDAEARQIAERIQKLIDSNWQIGPREQAHAIRYEDIYILLHRRTHAPKIEQALQQAGIPYTATTRGTLLEQLGIRDIRALLTLLHSPMNNLALAQVLRSPIFAATNEVLIELKCCNAPSWWDALQALATQNPLLAVAASQISRWKDAAQTLPLHDLLDKIYFEGDILARYKAASEPSQQGQIVANLQRLLELALEVDSGRYPSVSRFEEKLKQLATLGKNGPSEPDAAESQGTVKILTIHEAKGLEAPVVFFSNLDAAAPTGRAGDVSVDWPATEQKPSGLLLHPAKKQLDSKTQQEIENEARKSDREAANLIYVAMTRATQLLILTAAESKTSKNGKMDLYEQLCHSLEPLVEVDSAGVSYYGSGDIPKTPVPKVEVVDEEGLDLDIPLQLKIKPELPGRFQEVSPSRAEKTDSVLLPVEGWQDTDALPDGTTRGIAIHRFIEVLSGPAPLPESALRNLISADLNLDPTLNEVSEWLAEATAVVNNFPEIFTGDYLEALNEAPVCYRNQSKQHFGIIDRLLIYQDRAIILDYKTHRINESDAGKLAAVYDEQLTAYAAAIQKIYPDKAIQKKLLFTFPRILLDLN
ncbi:MAG: UvrD-helicase domain-containing protein [Thiotrichales bacterium]